jgi:hypothetical protein
MPNQIQVTDGRKPSFLWIDSSILWEMQLNPYEGWAYNRIVYRAGGGSTCFEAKGRMAEACGMGLTAFKKAIKGLMARNMIKEVGQVKHSNGAVTDEYTLADSSEWIIPPSPEGKNRREATIGNSTPRREATIGNSTPRREATRPPIVSRLDRPSSRDYKQDLVEPDLNKQDPTYVASLRSDDCAIEVSVNGKKEEGSQEEISHDGYYTQEVKQESAPPAANSKSLRVQTENPYKLDDPSGFENFWAWYKKRMCAPGNSAIGSKAKAADGWRHLEKTNFMKVGRDEFRKGCSVCLAEVEEKQLKVKHACGFLRGDRSGGKSTPPPWLEKVTVVDTGDADAFLSKQDEPSSSKLINSEELLKKQMRAELDRLGMFGVLPRSWKERFGRSKISDLSEAEKRDYLDYLRSLDEKPADAA